jgi:hypothetical protein
MDDSIAELLAARQFVRDSILGPDYHFPDELALAIDLTDTGENIAAEIREKFSELTAGDVSAVLLGRFADQDDLLVNTETSSVSNVFTILSREVQARRINYPLVFGRPLHDEFIANFGATPIESLTREQTQRLVSLTPQGVFQVDHWVSGPFGLLKSAEQRMLPPQSCGPVIRCLLVSCNKLHHIQLRSSAPVSAMAFRELARNREISVELARKLFDILTPDDVYYRVNHPGGLPWLIGNGFTSDELARLTEVVLAKNTGGLRELANALLGGSTSKKAPSFIASTLSHAALIQLLLLLDNVSLVEHIESAIDEQLIAISSTEIRRSFENRHLNGGAFRVDAEASRLGVRFIPERNFTAPRMLALIKAVFADHETALSWQLRNEPGSDTLSKLEECLQSQDPKGLIFRLLFSSQEALERTFNVLKYGLFSVPTNSGDEKSLAEKIMWKLGSPLPTPKPAHAALKNLVGQMLDAAESDYPSDDARVTNIRNVGMSMFVELEDLLRAASNFACWALLNDHYELHPLDRFRYYESHARRFSNDLFGAEAIARGASFPYDPTGANSLSVLISSFRVLADVCDSHLRNSTDYMRPRWQLPSFYNHGDIQQFPLQHTVLFLDLRPENQQRILDSLRSVSLTLTRTDICERRNSLGHPRESFPTNEKLIEAVQAIRTAVGFLSTEGLLPVIRTYDGEQTDKFGRRRIRMVDGAGNEILLTAPNQLSLLNLPRYREPQIIVRDAILSGTLQPARFEVANDSPWAEMWRDVGLIGSWLSRQGDDHGSEDKNTDLVANPTGQAT